MPSSDLGERIRVARKKAKLTQVQLAAKIGIKQPSLVEIEKGKSRPEDRTLILLSQALRNDLGMPWLTEHAIRPYEELKLLGEVCAGRGIDGHTDPDAPILNIPAMLVKNGESFCLKVRGDSMVGDGIHDGDILVVRRQSQADAGQVVIALHEGQVYVRRLAIKRPITMLVSANPAYLPVSVTAKDEFEIQAVVTGLIRNYEE